jgi:mono/diheme cytochrome c family protein
MESKKGSGMKELFRAGLATAALLCSSAIAAAQDQAQIEAGEQLYDEHCASCHGEKLRTTGSAADLKELRADDRPRFDKALAEGRGQMPSWQGVLSADEMNQVWTYIRAHAR